LTIRTHQVGQRWEGRGNQSSKSTNKYVLRGVLLIDTLCF
jgi:hypothetical protein